MRTLLLIILAGGATLPAAAQHRGESGHDVSRAHYELFAALAHASAPLRALPEESRWPQDPADSLWRAAREALNRGENARAAAMYRQIRTGSRYAGSAFRAPSYYWEAFSRHRIGTRTELETALEVLERLRRDHPRYENTADVDRLVATVTGQLAQLGDPAAARSLSETARAAAEERRAPAQGCDPTQLAAVEALNWMSPEEALPIVRAVMARRDACERMRETALFVATRAASAEAEAILLDVLRNDPSTRVREAAVSWLATVDSDRATAVLEEIIRTSTERRMLEVAVFALARRNSERATAAMRALVAREDVHVDARIAAVVHLGSSDDAGTFAYLRDLYGRSSDTRIKEAVLYAVLQPAARRGNTAAAAQRTPYEFDEATADWLLGIAMNERENTNLRTQAMFLIGQHRVLPLNRLVEMYRGTNERGMKQQIMYSVARSSDPEAIVALMEIVRSERDDRLRQEGIHWIGRSRDPRRTQFIAELIGG